MHCFGEGDGSEKQETGISNRQIVLESRSSPPSPLPRWAEECWLGRTTRLNKRTETQAASWLDCCDCAPSLKNKDSELDGTVGPGECV